MKTKILNLIRELSKDEYQLLLSELSKDIDLKCCACNVVLPVTCVICGGDDVEVVEKAVAE